MPYQLALIVWQAVTLLLYLLAIRAIVAHSVTAGLDPGHPRPLACAEGVMPATGRA